MTRFINAQLNNANFKIFVVYDCINADMQVYEFIKTELHNKITSL